MMLEADDHRTAGAGRHDVHDADQGDPQILASLQINERCLSRPSVSLNQPPPVPPISWVAPSPAGRCSRLAFDWGGGAGEDCDRVAVRERTPMLFSYGITGPARRVGHRVPIG